MKPKLCLFTQQCAVRLFNSCTHLTMQEVHMTESLNTLAKHPQISFFFRINSALKIGMIKLEAKAKKNTLNPSCFCAVPNIIIKVITKASFLYQNKMCSYLKKEKMKNTLQHQW